MKRLRRSWLWIVAGLVVSAASAQDSAQDPVPTELTESVQVRLVTISVVALDENERTVADLGRTDFRLLVDGKETAIDTLDVFCDGGAEDDPTDRRPGDWATPKDLSQGTRRVVLAFDYMHLVSTPCPDTALPGPCNFHTKALREYQRVFAAKPEIGDEEVMIVAVTGGLRVEQPFTRDRDAVIETLHRMEHDVSLWNGNFSHLTEYPLFTSLRALVTVLRTTPGPKAVVFVSVGPGPGLSYQLEWERLAAAAGEAQATFYPVDSSGLFRGGRTGGPPGLWMLASMTGGRLTRNINDTTVGYARARRDLGCRYTLGFYDRKPEIDRPYRLTVEGKRPGLRLYYATRYTFPSPKERRRMGVEAAYLVPGQFEGGGLRAHVFPTQPANARAWNAILAVDFPVAMAGASGASSREFGAVLRRGPDVVHSFHRSISLESSQDGQATEPRVTFVEPVTLRPGQYALTVVLVDPAGESPYGAAVDLVVPPIPTGEAILVGPILGRRRGNDVVVYSGGAPQGAAGDRVGDRDDFRPLIIGEVNRAEPLAALTHACVVRPKASDGPWSVARRLETDTGVAAGSLADVVLHPPARTPVHCERLLDELPVARLKPGKYTFRAVIAGVGNDLGRDVVEAAPFEVTGD